MRLIDADALKAEWQNGFYKKIVDALMDDAPTVDAVPVVRCKDCKWFHEDGWCESAGECTRQDRTVVLDWFCAGGERKDDGKN